jgi:hypothetical protein
MLQARRVKQARAVLLAAGLGWLPGGALAAQPAPPSEAGQPRPGSPPAPSTQPAAPLPDQTRGYARPPGVEPEDVVLFVPRLVMAVPRYTLKFVFYPITQTLAFIDRHAVIENITDILYNDARTAGVVPKLAIDTFFGPSIGLKAFHDDLGGHDEQGSIEGRFGGRYQLASQVKFAADRFAGTRLWLESLARFEIEPGLLFQGIGNPPEQASGSGLGPTEAAVETRFRQERLLSLFRAGYTVGSPGELTQLGATAIYNHREFARKTRGSGPSTENVYDTSRLVGYDDGVTTLEANLNLIVDTRDVEGSTARGVYIEAFGGGVPRARDYGFWHYGAEATGYFNLYRKTRVLVVRAMVESVEGDSAHIPFSDLPRLGGPNRLRGYPLDRFRDKKAALGTLEYHYPIHQFVAGALYVDAGRVESRYSGFFEGGSWKTGFGGGFVFRSRDRILFSVDLAYGDGVHFYLTSDPLRAFAKRDEEL